ncbi:hypothetical protein HYW67_00880 [Candidatus Parcubacteria bacterium]|nr:hypothetical protein [Candidatus Parcubacteria bacterium]
MKDPRPQGWQWCLKTLNPRFDGKLRTEKEDRMLYEGRENRTLAIRLAERVVEKLCGLRRQVDEADPRLYHLFSADGVHVVSVRTETKPWEEGVYTQVRIMDPGGAVLVEENVDFADSWHPFKELIVFLRKPSDVVTPEAEAFQKLLA